MATRLPLGLPGLDAELGGLPPGCLVHVYGPPGSGKSTLVLTAARSLVPSLLVLPEQVHPERLRGVLGDSLGRALVTRPPDLEAQDEAVERAASLLEAGRARSVVLDSVSYHYRFAQLASTAALRRLYAQLHTLRAAARAGGGLALFTNQVRGGPNGQRPVGGPAVAHAADVVLELSVLDGPWRRVHLEKHPLEPPGRAWDVRLGPSGFQPTG